MEEITIGMTAYNSADFIEESINNLLSQSEKNFKLIISDDASTAAISSQRVVELFSTNTALSPIDPTIASRISSSPELAGIIIKVTVVKKSDSTTSFGEIPDAPN